jgi:hypothetical protein
MNTVKAMKDAFTCLLRNRQAFKGVFSFSGTSSGYQYKSTEFLGEKQIFLTAPLLVAAAVGRCRRRSLPPSVAAVVGRLTDDPQTTCTCCLHPVSPQSCNLHPASCILYPAPCNLYFLPPPFLKTLT